MVLELPNLYIIIITGVMAAENMQNILKEYIAFKIYIQIEKRSFKL